MLAQGMTQFFTHQRGVGAVFIHIGRDLDAAYAVGHGAGEGRVSVAYGFAFGFIGIKQFFGSPSLHNGGEFPARLTASSTLVL